MKYIFSLGLLVLYLCSDLLAQDTLATVEVPFRFQQNVLQTSFLHQDTKDHLLFIHEKKRFFLASFDDGLNLTRNLVVEKPKRDLYLASVRAIINLPDTLFLYTQINKTARGHVLLTIDKATQNMKRESLNFQEKPKDKLIQFVIHNGKMIRWYVNPQEKVLRICVLEKSRLIQHQTFPFKDFRTLALLSKAAQRREIFANISHQSAGRPDDFARKKKIYTFPDRIILTLEDSAEGKTYLLNLSTETWTLTQQTFRYPKFLLETSYQNMNSTLRGPYLYQVIVNRQGLTLAQQEVASQTLIQQQTFVDDAAVKAYFGGIYRQTYGKFNRKKVAHPVLLRTLPFSIYVYFLENQRGDLRLQVGSYEPRVKDNFLTQTFTYGEGVFDETTLEIAVLAQELPPTQKEKVYEYVQEPRNEIPKGSQAVHVFSWRGKAVIGYGNQRKYYLVAFE